MSVFLLPAVGFFNDFACHFVLQVQIGVTTGNTTMCFEKSDNSPINLIGKCKGLVRLTIIVHLLLFL